MVVLMYLSFIHLIIIILTLMKKCPSQARDMTAFILQKLHLIFNNSKLKFHEDLENRS